MQHRFSLSPRLIAALLLLAALAGVYALNLTAADAPSRTQGSAASERVLAEMPVADRFALLASSHSNRCNLAAMEMRRMSDHMRLQGACCFPMDRARYAQQVRDLRPYRRSGLVPSDPYDVSVGLAKHLLRLRKIKLSPQGRASYRRATKASSLGGPCCCPCWRWQAFKGQAKFLIARRHYSAARVGALWKLEEGCGGPANA